MNLLEAEEGWPKSMPCLNTIKAGMVPYSLPQQLVGYSQLRNLDMTCYSVSVLPSWFSQFTQLDTLRVRFEEGFSKFPECVLHLKQLSSLNLACNDLDRIDLPVDIVRFSEFCALTRLDLRSPITPQYSAKARKKLQHLNTLLGPDVLLY